MNATASVTAEALLAALPQTQCRRCGFDDCRGYADAIAGGQADIDRCPPGGAEGVERLSRLTGRPVIPIDPAHGVEAPRTLAVIDEPWCIGCTLCIQACPVDCIVGASRQMHAVIESLCTGCELCVPACPVDCISLVPASGVRTGWAAWSAEQADEARSRYEARRHRMARAEVEQRRRLEAKARDKLDHLEAVTHAASADELARKRAVIEAVLAKARAGRADADAPARRG